MRRLLIFALACAACDDPTELPKSTTEEIGLEPIVFDAEHFVPPDLNVFAFGQSSGFDVSLHSMTETYPFKVCAACPHGATISKPEFRANFSHQIPLPVNSGPMYGGWVRFSATNNLSFDLLRPAAGSFGSIRMTARTTAPETLGSKFINGTDRAFPPGHTFVDSVHIAGTLAFSYLYADISIHSPAGDVVTIDTAATITFTAEPFGVRISQALVSAERRMFVQEDWDLTNVDRRIIESADSGHVRWMIEHPFTEVPEQWWRRGTITLQLGSGINKTAEFTTSTTSVTMPMSKSDLARILGRITTITVTSDVEAQWHMVVTPRTKMTLTPSLIVKTTN